MESLAEQDELWLTQKMPHATDADHMRFCKWVGEKLAKNDKLSTEQARQDALHKLVEHNRTKDNR